LQKGNELIGGEWMQKLKNLGRSLLDVTTRILVPDDQQNLALITYVSDLYICPWRVIPTDESRTNDIP